MTNNMLKLNGDKTEVMLFASKHNLRKLSQLSLEVDGIDIKPASTVKNLGVHFDSTMNMESYVNYLCKQAYFQLRNIGHIRRYLTHSATASLINGLITSKLDYCNALLYGLSDTQCRKLQRVQNMAARILSRTSKYNHITPILKDLHWLPIKVRIEFKINLLTFKALHHLLPNYVNDLLSLYRPKRVLRSQDTMNLDVPRILSSSGERSFCWAAPHLWNKLPMAIRSIQNLTGFKRALKTHLYTQYFH